MTKTKITPLYERPSHDDELQVRAILSATKTGFVKDKFTYKLNEIFL